MAKIVGRSGQREFGGKVYTLGHMTSRKSDANEYAKRYRGRGKSCRVVKLSGGYWGVFVRR